MTIAVTRRLSNPKGYEYGMGSKNTKTMKPSNFEDLAEQTQFTEADITSYYQEFMKTHPKGRITKDEMKKQYKKLFPDGDPLAFTHQLFSVYDADRDGTIDFREFISGIGMLSRGTMEQKLLVAFRCYDLDNNGYISRWELQSVITAIYKTIAPLKGKKGDNVPVATANAVFKSLDKDKDDKVTFEEFSEGVQHDPDIMRLIEAMAK